MGRVAREHKQPVTVRAVAQYAGVSAAAVSTVLANRQLERRIAPATVERIRAAVRDLGYVPNVTARRLRTHDPRVGQIEVGILTTFEAPLSLVSRLVREVERAVARRGSEGLEYSVSIHMYHAGRLEHVPGILNAGRFNALVITNTLPVDDEFLRRFVLPYPAVVLGRSISTCACVLDTPGQIGRKAAQRLLERGRTDLAVLTPKLLTQSTAERAEAFRATVLKCAGVEAAWVKADNFTPLSGLTATAEHLGTTKSCNGVFAVTDSLALGALQAIKNFGYRIPDDVAVIGVGDEEHAELFEPALTCVGPATGRVVAKVVSQLLDLMRGMDRPSDESFVSPAVVLRASA